MSGRPVPLGEEQPHGLRVRPYALTGGRTRPTQDLPLETIILVTDRGRKVLPHLALEKKRIVELAQKPLAVAEVSALLRVPLGVARVLIGDLISEGLIDTHRARTNSDRPDLQLLERVLDGLQAL